MSDDATPRLNLPYLAAAQAQKHVTLNEALAALDGLVQTAVESRTVSAEPPAPPDGALYILPAGRTGPEWALHPPGALLRFEIGGWERLAAVTGALAYVKDEGRILLRRTDGWADLGAALRGLDHLERLGVGAAADAVNPLSVRANKALFAARPAADGGDGDLRLTFSKEAAPDVLSLLFQTGFSGRAELGLIGDDRISLKTSPDGAAWTTALVIDAAGRPRWPAAPAFGGFASAARTTAGPFTGYGALSKSLNRGGCFAPATGVFTAPVPGAYALHLIGRSNSASTALGVFELRVNGQALAEEMVETHGPYQELGATRVFDLAEGDTVAAYLTYTDDPQPNLQAILSGHLVG